MSANAGRVLAFDLGASGGRVVLAAYDGKEITLEEIHRFANDPVFINGTLYWDVLRLMHEVKNGILKAQLAGGFESLAVDTWGVDFGLLDKDGRLLENPVHYRDNRTAGMVEEAFKLIPKERFYNTTGNQFMEINTAFQLLSLAKNRPELLSRADKLLMMPDLFHYFLTGCAISERSISSTTQLFNAVEGSWAYEVIDKLGLPKRLFGEIVPPGTVIGTLSPFLCEELDCPAAKVIAVCSHDTQSAVTAVPAPDGDFLFISCGTWSLLGTECPAPIVNELSERYNITNESTYNGKTTFLKNIIGLWLLQESRRHWSRHGREYSFSELEMLALEVKPFACFIDPDAPEFVRAGNIPGRIQAYCERTGQHVPETAGEVVRCIYESLAFKYRYAAEQISACTGKQYPQIYLIGGGARDKLLCAMSADACNARVITGPFDATALGNAAVQFVANGCIESISEARRVIARSQKVLTCLPEQPEVWNKHYARFKKVTSLA